MKGLLQAAVENPYRALSVVLGDTLHPGGEQATRRLLTRADVGGGDTVLDLGCGAGAAADEARERGAAWLGVDRDPRAAGATLAARMRDLPLADASADVALSECALCLAGDLDAALAEARRVLREGGRLAASDVTLSRPIEGLPRAVAEPLCLADLRSRDGLVHAVEAAGFDVVDVRDHHADLVAMRDAVRERVDVDGLLGAMGAEGEAMLEGVEGLEAALAARELGYVSLVARA